MSWGRGNILNKPVKKWLVWLVLTLWPFPVLTACSTGTYPFDNFPEMHYQPSFRSQEPPRLSPPAQSVPITGKEVAYDFAALTDLKNPVPRTRETIERATQLFSLNCSVCHGPGGRGDGFMTQHFQGARASAPSDFASERVRSRTEGQMYWILTNGLGLMPSFGKLLTEEERWTLVHFIRLVQGQ